MVVSRAGCPRSQGSGAGDQVRGAGLQEFIDPRAKELVRQFLCAVEPFLTLPRSVGHGAGHLLDVLGLPAVRTGGRVENHERGECVAVGKLQDRRYRRHRMKHADPGLFSKVPVDGCYDGLVVLNEGPDAMRLAITHRIPAVIAKVIQDQVETIGQQ